MYGARYRLLTSVQTYASIGLAEGGGRGLW
jgi:hypothetical protein